MLIFPTILGSQMFALPNRKHLYCTFPVLYTCPSDGNTTAIPISRVISWNLEKLGDRCKVKPGPQPCVQRTHSLNQGVTTTVNAFAMQSFVGRLEGREWSLTNTGPCVYSPVIGMAHFDALCLSGWHSWISLWNKIFSHHWLIKVLIQ